MTWYPYNPAAGQELQTDIPGVRADRAFVAHLDLSAEQAAAADAAGVLAAVTDTGEPQEITEGLSAPFYPRNITATAGGVADDIKAIQVVIEGEDMAGNVISETLPAFTENTAGIVAGSKAFRHVSKVTIPAHDGNGATTAIGYGNLLGLPYKLQADTVIAALHNNYREANPPTVATSTSDISGNTIELDTDLDGSAVDVFLIV